MSELDKTFVLWIDYGYDGWMPYGHDTLDEAMSADKYGSDWVITRAVKWKTVEVANNVLEKDKCPSDCLPVKSA